MPKVKTKEIVDRKFYGDWNADLLEDQIRFVDMVRNLTSQEDPGEVVWREVAEGGKISTALKEWCASGLAAISDDGQDWTIIHPVLGPMSWSWKWSYHGQGHYYLARLTSEGKTMEWEDPYKPRPDPRGRGCH